MSDIPALSRLRDKEFEASLYFYSELKAGLQEMLMHKTNKWTLLKLSQGLKAQETAVSPKMTCIPVHSCPRVLRLLFSSILSL